MNVVNGSRFIIVLSSIFETLYTKLHKRDYTKIGAFKINTIK